MNCQNCDAVVLASEECCPICGAKLLHQRVEVGTPKVEDFTLTADEPLSETDEPARVDDEQLPTRAEMEARMLDSPGRVPNVLAPQVQWGGFFRRAAAFLIDLTVILLLCMLMGIMSYIGYKVGLSAHNRPLAWYNAGPLLSFLTLAWIGLATAYFVVFHGMDGRTIGKWLLGLRVVGEDREPVSYRRALLRWIGTVGLGTASFGLAFFWILWQREKRGWHDFLARTWVIRE